MKKLLTICLLLVISISINAQTETQTIQWINAKKVDIMNENPSTDKAQNFDIEKISSYLFPSSDNNVKYHKFVKWADITDITFNNKDRDILIKGKVVSASGKNYMILTCRSSAEKEQIDKFVKALMHMATLKGATLVKDDLF